jgi:hypothetical protein
MPQLTLFESQATRWARRAQSAGKRGNTKTKARAASVPLIASVNCSTCTGCGSVIRQQANSRQAATEIGTPLDLHNVFTRQIDPVLNACAECGEIRKEHGEESDRDYRRSDLPAWHGWHAFRRGLATNLNDLGVLDLTIQRILRHSDVTTTRKAYIKPLDHQVTAGMDRMEQEIRRVARVNQGRFRGRFSLINIDSLNQHQPKASKWLKTLVSAAGLEPATHALKGLQTLKTQHLEELLGGHSELL